MKQFFRIIIWAVFIIIVLIFMTQTYVLESIYLLCFGWISFLQEVIPYVQLNQGMLWQGMIAFFFLVILLHWFMRWLYPNYQKLKSNQENISPSPWKFTWTMISVTIFFLMFITMISVTGIIHNIYWLTQSPFTEITNQGYITRFNLSTMRYFLQKYYENHHQYPIVLKAIPFQDVESFKDFDRDKVDGWGTPILYSSDGQTYFLRSYGKNRILGGGKGQPDDYVFYSEAGMLQDSHNH